MFPWSQKAEICILDEQRAHIKPDHFYNTFTENNLHIEYVASEGYYIVKSNRRNESAYPFVEMYVFAKDREVGATRHHFILFHFKMRMLIAPFISAECL